MFGATARASCSAPNGGPLVPLLSRAVAARWPFQAAEVPLAGSPARGRRASETFGINAVRREGGDRLERSELPNYRAFGSVDGFGEHNCLWNENIEVAELRGGPNGGVFHSQQKGHQSTEPSFRRSEIWSISQLIVDCCKRPSWSSG